MVPPPRPSHARVLPFAAVAAATCAVVLAVGCAKPRPALPSGGTLRHFPIPWENAFPSDVAVDDAGRLWFTDRLTHAVGAFDLATESFQRIPTPTERSAPYGMVRAPDGTLWFAESRGRRLGRIDPAAGTVTEVELEGLAEGPHLLAWADGAVWFTARDDGAFGRYVPATGAVALWDGVVGKPYGIAATRDGAVWLGAYEGTRLFRVDARQDTTTFLDLTERRRSSMPDSMLERLPAERRERARWLERRAGLRRLAAAPDGRLWATGFGAGRVSVADPATGAVEHVPTLLPRAGPYGITVDPWGRVWFYQQGDDSIVVLDPETGDRRRLALPMAGGTVRHVAVDPERGRVWLPLSDVGVIALVELGGG